VWFVERDGRLLALTDLQSAKVRRMRRNPRVLVAPCRAGGKLRGVPAPAHAEILTSASDLDHVQALLRERYRISYRLVMVAYRLGRRMRGRQSVADGAALAITLDAQ
jgi:PPOX class probable F420-dependent enzyme